MPAHDSSSLLCDLKGARISAVARVLFTYRDVVDSDDGPLEFVIDQVGTVLLDGAGDGETLRIKAGPWEDPFAEPLSDENARYVTEFGKWSKFNYSDKEPYRQIVGKVITSLEIIQDDRGSEVGLLMRADDAAIWFVVEFDECRVYWEEPKCFPQSIRRTIQPRPR